MARPFPVSFVLITWLIVLQQCYAFPFPANLKNLLFRRSTLDNRYQDVISALNLDQQWSERIYISGRVKNRNAYFSRSAYIPDLKTEIDRIQGINGLNPDSLIIRLYADAIRFRNGDTITLKPSTTLYMYCRDFDADGAGAKTLNVKYSNSASVVFLTNSIPAGIKVNFLGAGAPHSVSAVIPRGFYGFLMSVGPDGKVESRGLKQPNTELGNFNYITDLSSTHGSFVEDDLVRLMRFQLMVADAMQKKDRKLSMDILEYVKATTATSAKAAAIYLQASATLGKLQITNGGSTFVSNLPIKAAKENLQARLEAARQLDDQFDKFLKMKVDTAGIQDHAKLLLDGAQNSQRQFATLSDDARKRVDQAESVLLNAQNEMKDLQLNIPRAYDKFQMGIEDLKFKTTLKIVFSVVQMVVSVGVGVATANPGSVAAVPAATGQMAAQIGTFSKIVNSLKAIIEKMGGMASINLKLQTMMNSIEKAQAKQAEFPEPVAIPSFKPGEDPISALYDMDEFRTQAQMAYDSLQGKEINGKDEYFQSLFNLADRGKAVVNAQLAYMQAAQAYSRSVTEEYYSKKYLTLASTYYNKLTDPIIYDVVIRAVFDRVADNRRALAELLEEYVGTYVFYSLNTRVPQDLQVPFMSRSESYFNAYATLTKLSNDAPASFRPQDTTFTLSSAKSEAQGGAALMFSDWKKSLVKGTKGLQFRIPASHSAFNAYSRVRILRVRAILNGVTSGTISSDILLPQYFDDKLIDSSKTMGFVMQKPSYLSFVRAYEGGGTIVTDGKYSGNDLLNPTPFGNWTIKMDAEAAALTTATGFTLEVQCEATRQNPF